MDGYEVLTEAQQRLLEHRRIAAWAALMEAERAWYSYFAECPVGDERTRASNIYEIIRTAPRAAQE